MSNQTVWSGRKASNITPNDKPTFRLLGLVPIATKSGTPMWVAGLADSSAKLVVFRDDADYLQRELGITIASGESVTFANPVYITLWQYDGKWDNWKGFGITDEPVSVQAPVTPAPLEDRRPLSDYDGETVTVISATPYQYGNYAEWKLELRADDGTLHTCRVLEHVSRTFKMSGHAALPDRTIGKATCNVEVVILYDLYTESFKVVSVYGVDGTWLSVTDATARFVQERRAMHTKPVTPDAEYIGGLGYAISYVFAPMLESKRLRGTINPSGKRG
jgi:hypothetical protein